MPDTSRKKRDILEFFLRAGIGPGMTIRSSTPQLVRADASLVGADKPLRWVLTTEAPATVFDWEQWDFVDEILLMDGMVHPPQVPLLDAHSRYSVEDILGSVAEFDRAETGGHQAIEATIRFASDDKAQRTLAKVRDGHLTDGSVGYRVTRSLYIPDGQEAAVAGRLYQGPVKISTGWELKEFSMTPIGADTLAKVRSVLRQ